MTFKLPNPTYIYHYDPDFKNNNDLFEFSIYGKADINHMYKTEKCPHCTRLYTEAQFKQALRDVLEQAAKACDDIGIAYRDLYKRRTVPTGYGCGYDPHTDGLSDGAWECEAEIRKMIGEIK